MPIRTTQQGMLKRHEDHIDRELVRAVLARMEKEALNSETLVTAAEIVKSVGRERLVRQIAWFLMGTVAATLVLLVLHSLRLLTLPADFVEKLGILFGLQISALLAIIVRRLLTN